MKDTFLQRWKLWVITGALALASVTPAFARISVSATEAIGGEIETWVDLDSSDDIGTETIAEVTLNGKTILREESVAQIQLDWGTPRWAPKKIVLLDIVQTYPQLCQSLFRLVDLAKSDQPYVTNRFGNCSGEPFVREQSGVVIFYFQRFRDQAEEAWRYSTKGGLRQIPVTSIDDLSRPQK